MIRVKCTGGFTKTEKFLMGMSKLSVRSILEKYGKRGVDILRANTPVDSGKTASMWNYTISTGKKGSSITWTNSSTAGSVPIVILLQYGHSTGNGGYVSGVDFINPSLARIFDDMSNDIWREVIKL